jgi:hypothetical protein
MHPMPPDNLKNLLAAGDGAQVPYMRGCFILLQMPFFGQSGHLLVSRCPVGHYQGGVSRTRAPSSPQGIKFVFVSACHSEPAGKAFASAGVPHVIAVKVQEQVPTYRISQVVLSLSLSFTSLFLFFRNSPPLSPPTHPVADVHSWPTQWPIPS